MLEALRKGAGSWIAKIFIGVLVLSFAVWGISDIFTGRTGTALATVGEQQISEEEYREVFQREIRQLSQRLNQQISVDQARQLGVDRQVLQRLMSQAALDNQVQAFNLAVPDQAIADRIVSDRIFQDARGQFDRTRFEQVLNNYGYTEQSYVAAERRNILRAEIAGIVDKSVSLPDVMIRAIHRQQYEKRSAKYFTLPASKAGEIAEPTEAEKKAYYEANKRRFTAPEFRTLAILRLEPSDLANTIDVDEATLRQAYEERKDNYIKAERRNVQQIVYGSADEAQAALNKINAGASFVDIAAEKGLKEVDYNLGLVAKSEIPDASIAEAAFSLEPNRVSEPVNGALGTALLNVTMIEPEQVKTFEEAAAELETQIGLERAQEEVSNMHDTVEDARAGGATLSEIAEKFNLPLINVDAVDRNGLGPEGRAVVDIPATSEVLQAAFESDVGVENDPINTENEGYVWFDVTEVTPEAVRPFEQVESDIVESWKTEQRNEELFKKAQELADRIKGGTSIEEVAASVGETVSTSEEMRRRDTSGPFSAAALNNLFGQKEGGVTLAPMANDQGFIVMQLASVNVPEFDKDADESKALARQLDQGLGEDLLQQYLSGLQESLGYSIDRQIWDQIRGSS